MKHIFYCSKCDIFTMSEKCLTCNQVTQSQKPARYVAKAIIAKYRQKAKKEQNLI
ncbi:ribosome biogenesis protein [Candidatus Woesearchaeota archaeon]|nr:ribosome biogenesis protein [Candidatus Woesearchaeota archaeon]